MSSSSKSSAASRQRYFVAGTDTDVGKTQIAAALLHKAAQQGRTCVGMKPVAAGCEQVNGEWRNSDADLLQQFSTMSLSYAEVNPYALEPAIAPHIAAEQAGMRLSVSRLSGLCGGVLMRRADLTLIEGAGGWRVPLNPRETLATLAKELRLPVVLIVGIRLGCINHALLTAEAIHRDGLTLAGWVANRIDPDMPVQDENVATLKELLPFPCWGDIPFLDNLTDDQRVRAIAEHLNIPEVP